MADRGGRDPRHDDGDDLRRRGVVPGGRLATLRFGAARAHGLDGSTSRRIASTDADPAKARLGSDVVYRYTGDGWDADIHATGEITSDEGAFDVRVALDVTLDGEPFFAREWREAIPRTLV